MAIVATNQVDIRMIKELASIISEPASYLFAVDIGDDVHYKLTLAQLAQLIKEIIMTDRIKSEKGLSIKANESYQVTFKDDDGNPSPFDTSNINIFINAIANDGYRVELQPSGLDETGFVILVDQDLTLDYSAIHVPNTV